MWGGALLEVPRPTFFARPLSCENYKRSFDELISLATMLVDVSAELPTKQGKGLRILQTGS